MFSVLQSKKLETRINKKKATVCGLLFFLSLFSFAAHAQNNYQNSDQCISQVMSAIESKQLYKDPNWLRLLHYRRTFPIFQSQADGKYFFTAKDGNKNPESEMKTFAHALCDGRLIETGKKNIPQLPARCLFPVREEYLRKNLGFNKAQWPTPDCKDLNQWRDRMSAGSLTLVFSSYYPNSPSSVFGHTLIRVNRKINGVMVNSPLLSQGVNYAAVSDTSNPLKYAIWGLFGGFRGEYAALPYFYKVREYSDAESRDLWEYDLNLTQEQVNLFVDHVWELGFTNFNYYYFNENCSYHLLTTLEAVVPNINPSEQIPFWVIPADTIKAVAETPGLIQKIEFRPSVYRQFLARYEKIKDQTLLRSAFKQVVFNKNFDQVKKLNTTQQALVMDAVLDYWDFKNFRDLIDPKTESAAFKQQLLSHRAKLPTTEELTFVVTEKMQPEKSHGSFRYGLGFGNESIDGNFAELDLRFALHDLLDDSTGLPEFAKIDFFRFRGRTYEQFKKTNLEAFRFVDVELLAPVYEFHHPISWRFTMGAERTRHLFCEHCMAPDFLIQGGYAYSFYQDKILTYALAGAHAYWPEGLGFLGGPQASAGLRFKWTRSIASLLEGEWQHILGPKRETYAKLNLETRYNINKDLALSLDLMKGDNNDGQALLKLFIYR